MRPLLSTPSRYRLPPEPLLKVMAAVAAGMFLGCWVIGPMMTHQSDAAPSAARAEPMSYEAMRARPDPFPYRTPSPQFDSQGPTHYAEAARERAQAELGGRQADQADDAWSELREVPDESSHHSRWRYRVPDRHAVY